MIRPALQAPGITNLLHALQEAPRAGNIHLLYVVCTYRKHIRRVIYTLPFLDYIQRNQTITRHSKQSLKCDSRYTPLGFQWITLSKISPVLFKFKRFNIGDKAKVFLVPYKNNLISSESLPAEHFCFTWFISIRLKCTINWRMIPFAIPFKYL